MGRSQEVLRPHIEAITPAFEAAISTIRDELEVGRIGRKEANVRRNSERNRFYAPFADKIRALREAQDLALAAYEEIINEATDRFVRDAGRARGQHGGECLARDRLDPSYPRGEQAVAMQKLLLKRDK